MSQTLHRADGENSAAESRAPNFSHEELARRRKASQRLAWVLGTVALALYLIGFLLKR
jgi:hypothetical protein